MIKISFVRTLSILVTFSEDELRQQSLHFQALAISWRGFSIKFFVYLVSCQLVFLSWLQSNHTLLSMYICISKFLLKQLFPPSYVSEIICHLGQCSLYAFYAIHLLAFVSCIKCAKLLIYIVKSFKFVISVYTLAVVIMRAFTNDIKNELKIVFFFMLIQCGHIFGLGHRINGCTVIKDFGSAFE